MHRPACVQWSADCRLILSPFRPSPSPAKGGEPGAHRGKSMHARVVQEFVSSCHVLSFSATPTGGGQTCVGLYEGVNMCWPVRGLQVPSRRPACLLPAPVLSARQSIRSSFPNSESAGQAQSSDQTHHSWLSSLGHSTHPRFQRAQTPIPECMHVDVSCLMFVSSLCLFLPSLGPKNRPLLSIFTHEPSSWHTAILDLSTF